MTTQEIIQRAKDFCQFVDICPTPYHVVDFCKKELKAAGYTHLKSADIWTLKNNGKYFVTIQESTVIAFAVGGKYSCGNGYSFVTAHTDSPVLKLKQNGVKKHKGFWVASLDTYGGGMWSTWFNRDLKASGRIIYKGKDGPVSKLFCTKKPIGTIPSVCVHLHPDNKYNLKAFGEKNLLVVLGKCEDEKKDEKKDEAENKEKLKEYANPLFQVILKDVGCKPEDVLDADVIFSDCQTSALCESQGLENDTTIRIYGTYHNEEVGSKSVEGAQTCLTPNLLKRIESLLSNNDCQCHDRSIANSTMFHVDSGHALHPFYPEKHEEQTASKIDSYPSVKYNGNKNFTSTLITGAMMQWLGKIADVKIEKTCDRNDLSGGSTLGCHISKMCGIKSLDIGAQQWSMHSIREVSSSKSIHQCIVLYKCIFEKYHTINKMFSSD
ncbi:hypothetical protein A3Q56_00979 [Intoshia linei]|uniref:Aspartyl aminopeptidase n=1 Tax=Intoshia linei TaxID=1819745 RepID=A0A177BAJ6_9BILA|nr:hypothetical protein A3Q56_00979 [Intoshia linei]